MKNLSIVFIFVFLLNTDILFTQIMKSYGIKVGTTYSTFDWKPKYAPIQVSPNIESINSYNCAVYGEIKIFSRMSFVLQLDYSQKGARLVYDAPNINNRNLTYERSVFNPLTYLSMPLLVKVSYVEYFPSLYMFLGPRFDYLIQKQIGSVGYRMIFDNLERVIQGSTIGFGVQASSLFFVECRYNLDFTNSSNTDDIALRNETIDLWLGFSF